MVYRELLNMSRLSDYLLKAIFVEGWSYASQRKQASSYLFLLPPSYSVSVSSRGQFGFGRLLARRLDLSAESVSTETAVDGAQTTPNRAGAYYSIP